MPKQTTVSRRPGNKSAKKRARITVTDPENNKSLGCTVYGMTRDEAFDFIREALERESKGGTDAP